MNKKKDNIQFIVELSNFGSTDSCFAIIDILEDLLDILEILDIRDCLLDIGGDDPSDADADDALFTSSTGVDGSTVG